MAIGFLIAATGGPTGTTPVTGAVDTTGATLIVAQVFGEVTGGTFSDSQSNTWQEITSADPTGRFSRVFWVASPSTSATHTFTFTLTNFFGSISVSAFTGTHASPLDDQATASSDSPVLGLQAGQVDPTEDGELVVAVTGYGAGGTQSIDGGFTIATQVEAGGSGQGSALAYLIQTTAASANPTWSYNSFTPSSATNITFKSAGGAVTITPGVGSELFTGRAPTMGFTINMPDVP